MKLKLFTLLTLSMFLFMCKSTEKTSFKPDYKPGPPAIVYKTKKDYSKNVPVILSDDKKTVSAYFGPSDLANKGQNVYPTQLNNDFLLDNIGISQNVAYTSLLIDSYCKSMKLFTAQELYSLIIDFDPLEEMYNCGNRSAMENQVETLNKVIDDKQLKNCKKLK